MPPRTCRIAHVLAASLLAVACAPAPAPPVAVVAPAAPDLAPAIAAVAPAALDSPPAPPIAVVAPAPTPTAASRPAPPTAVVAPAPTPPAASRPAPSLAAVAPAAEPAAADPPALTIVDRPITYDAARRARTITYRKRHQDPDAADITIDPKMIVLHFTGGGDLDATWRYFDRPTVERARKIIARAGDLNVSAHFLVDRDGTIVRLVPETWMARHVVGLNHLAIGVENVGDGGRFPLTAAQQAANVALVRDLVRRFPGVTHLIGHHEYLAFEGHPYFREREANYRTRKGDPGDAFMAGVRAGLRDLGLQGPPARDRPLRAAKTP